jgi:hypothetical protein
MKKLCPALFTGLAVVVLTAALDLTGKWQVETSFDDGGVSGGGFDCTFKQDGEHLTGTCTVGAAPISGELKEQNISWKMKAGKTQDIITFTGTVNEAGTSMKGRFTITDKGGSFTALKSK